MNSKVIRIDENQAGVIREALSLLLDHINVNEPFIYNGKRTIFYLSVKEDLEAILTKLDNVFPEPVGEDIPF